MTRERFLSLETIAEHRGVDVYWHAVKTRIRDFDHLREFLRERFPAIARCLPLADGAVEKIAAAIRLESGLERGIVESALGEHFGSDEYGQACLADIARYHDAIPGEPGEPVPESHTQQTHRCSKMGFSK